jgi:hypothetical protein
MQFVNTIEIRQSPGIIFSFVSNFCNAPQWNYAVIKTVQISKGAIGVGTIFKQQRRFLGRILEDEFMVTAYEAGSMITIKSIKADYPFLISYSFKATTEGVLITNSVELSGGIISITGFLLNNRVKKAVAENLGRLKELLEKL